jgi:serine/threonine protein phosphatase PrpC
MNTNITIDIILKKYIPDIENLSEQQINDFLNHAEDDIKAFLQKKWQEFQEEKEKNDQELQPDMHNGATKTPGKEQTERKDTPENQIKKTEEQQKENMENNNSLQNSGEKVEQDDVPKKLDQVPQIEEKEPMKKGPELHGEDAKEKAKNEAFESQIKGKYISFPNGKVNHEYTVSFDVETQLPEISEVEFEGLEQIGLLYNAKTKQITGTPTLAGDYKIVMHCKRKDWTPESNRPEYIPKEIMIIINPDPKSLWKNIQTPTDIEYYKPDSDKAFVKVKEEDNSSSIGKKEIARKNMVAASQRGRSHAHEGKPRDDDFKLNFDEATGWYTMVVADGAGSAQFSRKGSEIACQTAIEVCKRELTNVGSTLEEQIGLYIAEKSTERKDTYEYLHQIVGEAAFEAYNKICKEAQEKQRPTKDYATTFLLTVCKKFDFGWFVGAFWVGDGGIGIYNKEKQEVKILGEPDGGEFAGQTRFLTMPEIFKDRPRTRFEIVEDFTALILMTDGITDPKFETDANLNKIEKWNALWDDLDGNNEDKIKVDFTSDAGQAADQLLKWLDFWSPGNHDDRTIAILF